jgi:hypothetical protein
MMVEIKEILKNDTLNWHVLKFEYLIVKVIWWKIKGYKSSFSKIL